jgi:hypothetical protein
VAPTPPDRQRRWYEGHKTLLRFMGVIDDFRPTHKHQVGGHLGGLVNLRYRPYIEKTGVSLSNNRVIGLYKAENKRRKYDRVDGFRRAMTTHYMLPSLLQNQLATDCLRLASCVQEYITSCTYYAVEPEELKIDHLASAYCTVGALESRSLLVKFKTVLLKTYGEKLVGGSRLAPQASSTSSTSFYE